MTFEREVTGLGGCVRAIGEWSAASQAVGRLDVGDVEFFENVLGQVHIAYSSLWLVQFLLRKEHLVKPGFGLLLWATGSSRRLSLERCSLSGAFCHFYIILQHQRVQARAIEQAGRHKR